MEEMVDLLGLALVLSATVSVASLQQVPPADLIP